MSRKTINDLRDALFAQLERLNGEASPEEIERAKAVSGVAKVIVETAKVEIDHMRVTGAPAGSGFIPEDSRRLAPPPPMAMINNTRSDR
jgi:hypothetical protein